MASSRPIEDRIGQLRLRAEEVRTIADGMQAPDARRRLYGVAANCERLATYLETVVMPAEKRERDDRASSA